MTDAETLPNCTKEHGATTIQSLTDGGEQFDADEDGRLVVPSSAIQQRAVAVERQPADKHQLQQLLDLHQVGLRHARVVTCSAIRAITCQRSRTNSSVSVGPRTAARNVYDSLAASMLLLVNQSEYTCRRQRRTDGQTDAYVSLPTRLVEQSNDSTPNPSHFARLTSVTTMHTGRHRYHVIKKNI